MYEEKISSWVEKVKKEGVAWCGLCDCEIHYKSAGKRQLTDYGTDIYVILPLDLF